VGNHVKAYASENATVVVGAVIDPEMSDELRVTVVATGIGAEKKPDIQLVSKPAPRPEPVAEVRVEQAEEPVQNYMSTKGNGNTAAAMQPAVAPMATPMSRADGDYLDIPAFLRKQAD
jgi:cell division protein FtsZ